MFVLSWFSHGIRTQQFSREKKAGAGFKGSTKADFVARARHRGIAAGGDGTVESARSDALWGRPALQPVRRSTLREH